MRGARWRPLLVAPLAILGGLAAGSALLGVSRRWVFPVAVAGESMTPSFEDGDYVLVLRTRPPRGDAATGLVVCVRGPEDRLLLKRIVGIPGDSLRIGDRVYVGGHPLLEPYVHGDAPAESFRGVRLLHDDEYVVLGDHRAASTDSRDFGPVRTEQIEGIAWLRYWPPERAGLVRREARRFAPPDGAEVESGNSPIEG